jgi:hypothetical protein
LNSDNLPVHLTISDKIITLVQNILVTNKHNDNDYFNYLLETNINVRLPLKTSGELERELNALTSAIQEAAWNSTYVTKTKLKGLNLVKGVTT